VSEPIRHITTEQALQIARVAVGGPIAIRDLGLLDAAVNRPRASLFGQDAYPDLWHMAAALLHSIVTSHPLVDGNKRLGWLAAWVFLAKNDIVLEDIDTDDAYDLVIAIADGSLRDVPAIAHDLHALVPH
jgi:death on curing protein